MQSYFHRTYAAYGGIFIVMAIIWGWIVGGNTPDVFDGIGAVIALTGVAIIFYMPRKGEKSIWSK
jgi:small multidrug resistance family-3 protein